MNTPKKYGLLLVDIQGKLAELVENSNVVLSNTEKLIKSCQILSIETVVLEQNPKGLGTTHPCIDRHLNNIEPLIKYSLTLWQSNTF